MHSTLIGSSGSLAREAPIAAAQQSVSPAFGQPLGGAREGAPGINDARPDGVLFAIVLSLLGFGVVMVYSASAVYAAQKFGASDYFLRRELLWSAIGLCGFAVAARIDYAAYRRWIYPLLGLTFVLLVSVLLVGVRINGARRWFHLAGVSFQPAELAKLAVVLYLAHSLARKADKVRTFTVGFLPHMAVASAVMLLLLKQPDLGTAVILGATTLLLLFVAGARLVYLLMAVLAAAPIVYQVIVGTPFRLLRMLAYLDPWPYRFGVGYQITESLISIGSGGVFGLGLGDGKQKLFFLPEAHTDYILAIVGEELGLVGLCCIAASFIALVWRGARAALRARDAFGCYLGFGITALFGLQAVVNLGVVLGSLPTKGLPLPFVSFGGSTLVVDLVAAGMLLNISRGAAEPPSALRASPLAWLSALLAPDRGNRWRGHRIVIVEEPTAAQVRRSQAPTMPGVLTGEAEAPETEAPETPARMDAIDPLAEAADKVRRSEAPTMPGVLGAGDPPRE